MTAECAALACLLLQQHHMGMTDWIAVHCFRIVRHLQAVSSSPLHANRMQQLAALGVQHGTGGVPEVTQEALLAHGTVAGTRCELTDYNIVLLEEAKDPAPRAGVRPLIRPLFLSSSSIGWLWPGQVQHHTKE